MPTLCGNPTTGQQPDFYCRFLKMYNEDAKITDGSGSSLGFTRTKTLSEVGNQLAAGYQTLQTETCPNCRSVIPNEERGRSPVSVSLSLKNEALTAT